MLNFKNKYFKGIIMDVYRRSILGIICLTLSLTLSMTQNSLGKKTIINFCRASGGLCELVATNWFFHILQRYTPSHNNTIS